jgi:hypothetical protein
MPLGTQAVSWTLKSIPLAAPLGHVAPSFGGMKKTSHKFQVYFGGFDLESWWMSALPIFASKVLRELSEVLSCHEKNKRWRLLRIL